ncbi:hypothetical protein [Tabrizicola sp.]|uniref:hypothetical protein n=1 Tax=Tabrizicola sp. TaxID=2005166 RepID=UPI0035AF97BB
MTAKQPPIPPENRSPKGPGEGSATSASDQSRGDSSGNKANPDKTGQAGNTRINTTNQGHQQDR